MKCPDDCRRKQVLERYVKLNVFVIQDEVALYGVVMISEICVLSPVYEPLLKKTYRKDHIKSNTTDVFVKKLNQDGRNLQPHFKDDNVFYFYIQRNNIIFFATSTSELSPVAVIEILSRLYHVCKDFCGTVSENSIKSNLLLLYEVLDEMLDYGFVQLASTDKLKPYISSEPVVIETSRSAQEDVAARLLGIDSRVVPFSAANKPVIRSQADMENRRNEVFVDVVERLTAVVDSSGVVSRMEINGSVNMKNFLIGSPLIKIALNDDLVVHQEGQLKGLGQNVQLDRCHFHQCVKLDEFDSNRILRNVFSIMTYSANGEFPITVPLRVMTFLSEIKGSRDVDMTVRLKCEVPANCQFVYIAVKINIPKSVTSMSQSLSGPNQTADLRREEGVISWKMRKLPGATEAIGKFRLISQGGDKINKKEIGPLIVDYEVSGYTCTGLQIRYMRVYDQEHSYVPFRWIRYITVTESYIVTLS
ncbi:AP-4 complex subunit mu-1-like [Haliotis rubra]|uniref:AP-4 complex subunit mu-1-like n=1 Tax=Haliotis rubra TaxID=36100 RepID=UPI001EE6247E|nr:AP-4 complex subunit mu-1-like [Haliotis rubra]